MKSFFDFNGRTEAIEGLGAGAGQRKAEATVQSRQAVQGRPMKSFFDFNGRTEAIEGLGAGAGQRKAEATVQRRQA
ncbi:hypothetical protein J7E71_09065 [Mesobacillus foraminis]|uniref:hypothetical protein n=1 Tax=Mesobacillus foraminis TaxID=279826 RepID=UPI001BEA2664|nr:hypothetical protein [Mesobacillus foraminis]MBT2756100.1 hypothetical protein [Mesobacillus foraminis]